MEGFAGLLRPLQLSRGESTAADVQTATLVSTVRAAASVSAAELIYSQAAPIDGRK